VTSIKGSSTTQHRWSLWGKQHISKTHKINRETMALVLNNIAVTTTTPSFTRPIPSPGPFSFTSGNPAHRCLEDGIFTYSNAYPIPHCVHRNKEKEVQSMNFFNSSDPRFDLVILDDDALTSLILEMELDKMNPLPELQVVNADLTDCNVLTSNKPQQTVWFFKRHRGKKFAEKDSVIQCWRKSTRFCLFRKRIYSYQWKLTTRICQMKYLGKGLRNISVKFECYVGWTDWNIHSDLSQFWQFCK